jgi:hypothetical protein
VITYRLSNRQRKDLLIRGTSLTIAIPQPYRLGDDDDPVEFARRSLPDDAGAVESASWEDIAVDPVPTVAGLTGLLGSILVGPPSVTDSRLHLVVRVALVRLQARDERRRMHTPQWPGVAICGGEHYPREAASGE